jgi:hypothetical protein
MAILMPVPAFINTRNSAARNQRHKKDLPWKGQNTRLVWGIADSTGFLDVFVPLACLQLIENAQLLLPSGAYAKRGFGIACAETYVRLRVALRRCWATLKRATTFGFTFSRASVRGFAAYNVMPGKPTGLDLSGLRRD